MQMELNEALKTLKDAGAVVTEAMSPELKKVLNLKMTNR